MLFRSLVHLKNMPNLNCFMIGGVQLQYIVPMLEAIGKNLTKLRFLCYGGNSGKINISLLSRHCPNLISLTLSGNSIIADQGWTGSILSERPFQNLKELYINTHAYLPFNVWSILMTQCLNLTCLKMTSCEGLWDGALASLLNRDRKSTRLNSSHSSVSRMPSSA